MTFNRPKHILRLFSILIAVSMVMTLVTPVCATDSVDSLEQSTTDLKNELSGLQDELENLSTEISSLSKQISDITEEIKQTKSELAIAKGNEEAQYASMKARIKYMYENGNTSLLEMLLSATSMADFLNRADFFSTISEYDRNSLEKLVDTQNDIALKEAKLMEEQENLLALQEELNNKETSLKSRISNTSSELTVLTAQLEKAREDAKNAQKELNQPVEPVIPPKAEKPVIPPKAEKPDDSSDSGNVSDKDTDTSASASDIELFAALIECEAGSRNYDGMLAVASVVVNRMKHPSYPDTLRGVIYQAGQFSPVHDGKVDRVLKRGVKNSCVTVANDALAGKNNVGNCLSFRSASSGHTGTIIGGNVFF